MLKNSAIAVPRGRMSINLEGVMLSKEILLIRLRTVDFKISRLLSIGLFFRERLLIQSMVKALSIPSIIKGCFVTPPIKRFLYCYLTL